MNVQRYIVDNGWDALGLLGITVKNYGDYSILNYSQIDSPKFHPVVMDTRGLILDSHNTKVLCRPFERFFNYGEDVNTEKFRVGAACVWEKIDGTLVNVWFNPFAKSWQASTRKMALAEGECPTGKTFAEIIYTAMGCPVNDFMEGRSTNYTYIFELVSPETRVVKAYPEPKLYLLGMRDNISGTEIGPVGLKLQAKALGVDMPKIYRLGSLEEAIEAAKHLPESEEGYVAAWYTEGFVWRLKIKNPAHVALSKLHNNGALTPTRICGMILEDEADEYLTYFPEDAKLFAPYCEAVVTVAREVASDWEQFGALDGQKEFAIAVKNRPYSGILFKMRKGLTFDQAFYGANLSTLVKLLESVIKSKEVENNGKSEVSMLT